MVSICHLENLVNPALVARDDQNPDLGAEKPASPGEYAHTSRHEVDTGAGTEADTDAGTEAGTGANTEAGSSGLAREGAGGASATHTGPNAAPSNQNVRQIHGAVIDATEFPEMWRDGALARLANRLAALHGAILPTEGLRIWLRGTGSVICVPADLSTIATVCFEKLTREVLQELADGAPEARGPGSGQEGMEPGAAPDEPTHGPARRVFSCTVTVLRDPTLSRAQAASPEGAGFPDDDDDLIPEEALVPQQASPSASPSTRTMRVFDAAAALKVLQQCTLGDSEHKERVVEIAARIRTLGGDRPLVGCDPEPDEVQRILLEEMPNFEAMIRHAIWPALMRAKASGVLRLPNLLAHGEPGTGKTRIARRLAELLGLPLFCLDMSAIDMAGAVVGTDLRWSGSREGEIFRLLVLGGATPPVANPLVVVEEIDKAGGYKGGERTAAALLTLTERSTACKFEDRSYPGVYLDASAINWIFTGNEIDLVSAPLRSRCTAYAIAPMTAQQRARAARTVVAEAVRDLQADGVEFDASIDDDLCERLSVLPLRQMRQTVDTAIGLALSARRRRLLADDLRPVGSELTQARLIGFS